MLTRASIVASFAVATLAGTASAIIIQGGSSAGLTVFTFDGVPNPLSPWTPYQSIGGPGFVMGERMMGQTTAAHPLLPDNEIVSGSPSSLVIDPSRPTSTGVSVFDGLSYAGDLDMAPEGILGWPDPNSLGEGAWTVVFDIDQSVVAFDVAYIDVANSTHVLFYDRAGALIGSVDAIHPAAGVTQFELDFMVVSGPGIAAMTINNDDQGGLGYDDLRYTVPAPAAGTLLGLGLLATARRRR